MQPLFMAAEDYPYSISIEIANSCVLESHRFFHELMIDGNSGGRSANPASNGGARMDQSSSAKAAGRRAGLVLLILAIFTPAGTRLDLLLAATFKRCSGASPPVTPCSPLALQRA